MGLQPDSYVERVNKCIIDMAARFRSQSPMPFEMFLLGAGDSYHHDLLTGMRGIRPGGADRATDELRIERHEEAFSGVGLQGPSRASLEQYASGALSHARLGFCSSRSASRRWPSLPPSHARPQAQR